MAQSSHRHRKNFWSSFGYYVVVVLLIVCLALLVKDNRSKRAERDAYKESLSKQETVEDLGGITITKPTDAPEDAAVRNNDANADEDSEATKDSAKEDKSESSDSEKSSAQDTEKQ
ncbi:hypothetical protein [Blautia sp. MSJ-19]|uniref:hypothetical protein n=1 Tax=Blautia sp. MSJ-19 TaxID=2841517 RepID=UPI001C0EBCB0|nr:hypothetical protein [Blautia sp. MSJ-19]MBU5481544.1 hypothetical protein [Blautia sp. MSJ-19]